MKADADVELTVRFSNTNASRGPDKSNFGGVVGVQFCPQWDQATLGGEEVETYVWVGDSLSRDL